MNDLPPLAAKDHRARSLFEPVNLLREVRRQRRLPDVAVPAVCLLDPDGDIVRHLEVTGRGRPHPGWACFHTVMWTMDLDGIEVGVVGLAVGAPFAVLVAEQLAASGCELVVSLTSAGRISPLGDPPYFVLVDRALRDEGTSLHYLPPACWSLLDPALAKLLDDAFEHLPEPVLTGSSWTTDAPYRETATAIAAAASEGAVCVEMEAAALYAYAAATGAAVVCVAHITNSPVIDGEGFEKGCDNGVQDALAVTRAVVAAVRGSERPTGSGVVAPDGRPGWPASDGGSMMCP
ncbi:MAG: nucleoside phosphorylase [Pseudonocardia sp.]|nr:nucleoside phosphorylase [Pseudonocardia sp.]